MSVATILIAGVDECGRGCLAGPVMAASVILNPKQHILGLKDSKALTDKKRRLLMEEIKQKAFCWAIGAATVDEIDSLNILNATLLAMKRAILTLELPPSLVLIDGNRIPELPMQADPIVKGDQFIECIMAASIIAKVTRDDVMKNLGLQYTQFSFAKHKAYGTKAHLQELADFGPTAIHRRSFNPVKSMLSGNA